MSGKSLTEFTVSELSRAIKRAVEDRFPYIQLRGEVSGYRGPHASGHVYFALKDANARIDAIIWKGVFSRMQVKPEEGMEVVASGKVTTFAGKSSYQIVIDKIEPAGVGALLAQLEARKKKLAEEGLFAQERKQPLPFLPATVGIITSPTGAVIRDMLHGFNERFPTHVIVWPVRVQGAGSGDEVAAAVTGFNALSDSADIPKPDVLIVARGGGSLEDLWGFNDENVVRAVAASEIPVISAVGHETDWTLIDLVADARAPTPTKAAEWAVPILSEQLERVETCKKRLLLGIRRELERQNQRLESVSRALPDAPELIQAARQQLDYSSERLRTVMRYQNIQLRRRLETVSARFNPRDFARNISLLRDENLKSMRERHCRAIRASLRWNKQRFENTSQLLSSLGYESVLRRGYALVRNPEGEIISSRHQMVRVGSARLEFMDGQVEVRVAGAKTGETEPEPNKSPKQKKTSESKTKTPSLQKREDARQGRLF